MAHHVGQCFLHDPVGRHLRRCDERRQGLSPDVDPRAGRQALGELLDRPGEALLVQGRGSQPLDDAPYAPDRRLDAGPQRQ